MQDAAGMPQNDDDLTRLADKRRRPSACFLPLYGAAACAAAESEDIATDLPHSAKINRDLTWGGIGRYHYPVERTCAMARLPPVGGVGCLELRVIKRLNKNSLLVRPGPYVRSEPDFR
jgi:hypothetical protein